MDAFLFTATIMCVWGRGIIYRTQKRSRDPLIGHWEQRDGEHSFLEEVLGEEALTWVKKSNDDCLSALGDPEADPLYADVLAILDSKDKIPYVRKIGNMYYNFWQDEVNPRGLWRRTTWESYASSNATTWEVVLDLDELGKKECESWVYKGQEVCDLNDDEVPTRTLIKLSRGGADATVVREFDLESKRFVLESEGGFVLPEAKSRLSWKNKDLLLIGTDFGNGESMTDSGYPRSVHEWRRGTQYLDAPLVFEGEASDVSTIGYLTRHGKHQFEWRCRSLTFYTSSYSLRVASEGKESENAWFDLSTVLPIDVNLHHFADQLLISLRTDWQQFKGGALLSVDIMDLVTDARQADIKVIFQPDERISLLSYSVLKTRLALHTLENVKSRITFLKFNRKTKAWDFDGREPRAVIRGASLSAVNCHTSDEYWFITNSFLTPSRLCKGDADEGIDGIVKAHAAPIKSLKSQFDASGLEEIQGEAISQDGTKIPYFLIRKQCEQQVPRATLMFGYGGFEISLTPSYTAVIGKAWLERGGIYVYTNIRGGGEFGPQWHQAALKENRNRAYEDFIAIAEKLISTGITTKGQLGIRGGSNGGLLMGNMLVRRPDLFGAVVCAVPLLDMKRYSHLLAGASWMAEYGNPDTSDWAHLQKYSAYHNIALDAAKRYPPMLMTTSTRDDRVHPYHARSFVKRLKDVGVTNTLYYENMEGGHGGAADSKQQAFMTVLYINFLKDKLRLE